MNILIIGSGGREHALALKISQSKLSEKVFVAPGNGGTKKSWINVDLDIANFSSIGEFALLNNVKIIVVGPEDPLVNGIEDFFFQKSEFIDIKIVGPCKQGAELEGSKDFAKKFMAKYDIPTAKYQTFKKETYKNGCKFLESLKPPYVLKADGLAAGKGVLILDNIEIAKLELYNMLDGKFGDAGNSVVIEEYLNGIEVSYFAYTNGAEYVLLPEAKDYKRIGEGDKGLNTGGMGAVSPVPFCTEEFTQKVKSLIVEPTIAGLKNENIRYNGFVFFGLMNIDGEPFVIEYNVRLGDPETEAILPRLDSDLVQMFVDGFNNNLQNYKSEFVHKYAVSTILVSGGYPEAYEKGKIITNIVEPENGFVFHAGTMYVGDNLVTAGGRVIAVTCLHDDLLTATNNSKKIAEQILFDEKYFRNDIGLDLLRR